MIHQIVTRERVTVDRSFTYAYDGECSARLFLIPSCQNVR